MKNKDKTDKNDWQPLRELALNTPYTMGYLSLMARRKQLKVKKIGRVWHSTMENIKEFEDTMRDRKEERKRQLQESYREKVKREVLKEIEEETEEIQEDSHIPLEISHTPEVGSGLRPEPENSAIAERKGSSRRLEPTVYRRHNLTISSDDTIFDEVQRELEDVLQEIRDREKKLRQDYLSYKAIHGDDGVEVYGNAALAREKQETEELSEKLIMDLGRLLNTANKIHEEEESAESQTIENDAGVAIPVRNKNAPHGHIRTMGMDFKRPENQYRRDIAAHSHNNKKHKDNFLSVPYSTFPFEHQVEPKNDLTSSSSQNKLLLFIAGLLVFIAAILIAVVVFG